MRFVSLGLVLVLTAAATSGCFSKRSGAVPQQPAAAAPRNGLIVTPQPNQVGEISLVNSSARYVIVQLGLGQSIPPGQVLSLYRKGLKVGEIRITGPQQDHLTAADLLTGQAQVGDDVLR